MKIQSKKKLKKIALKSGKDSFSLLQKEIAIMKKICHSNLVELFEVIDDPEKGTIYLIMDFMDLGNIGSSSHKMKIGCRGKNIPEDKLRKYFRDCLEGLDYRIFFFNFFSSQYSRSGSL